MTFRPTGFSETIFKERYALTPEETWEEACSRVAWQLALAEPSVKKQQYKDKFYDVLVNNLFVPGGRIWYNSGRNNPQLLNCFVLKHDLDSKEGWGDIAREMIITSMTGGGCGIDFSDVRPRGSLIGDQRGECPGPVELMELVDNCAEPIRAGGQRRVALMFSLDLDHPDIEEFLDKKLQKGKLTHANVSVRSKKTSDFIRAIKNDEDIELQWKGKGKKLVKARKIWDIIATNAYNSAEPGFLNWELALSESTISYIQDLVTTNPCGEIAMPSYDACCLGHLVLFRFVKNGKIDYELLGDTIRLAVRALDNVLTVNHYPLPEMKDTSNKFRRIGMGVTGLADMLAMLGYRYGSEEGNKFTDKLFRTIAKTAYEASVMLAIEKGAFPLCQPDRHVETGFVKRLPPRIKSLIKEHGIRNCAILTNAPTGTVSILSDNCSSGIEPMFSIAYWRHFWKNGAREKELVFHPLFQKYLEEGKDTSHFVSSHELDVRDHLEVQKVIQAHVDNAVSKTINMANDYPKEKMQEIWLEYLPYLKGTTFYREGTRGFVNEKGEIEAPPLTPISQEEAVRLFAEMKDQIKDGELVDCASGGCEI